MSSPDPELKVADGLEQKPPNSTGSVSEGKGRNGLERLGAWACLICLALMLAPAAVPALVTNDAFRLASGAFMWFAMCFYLYLSSQFCQKALVIQLMQSYRAVSMTIAASQVLAMDIFGAIHSSTSTIGKVSWITRSVVFVFGCMFAILYTDATPRFSPRTVLIQETILSLLVILNIATSYVAEKDIVLFHLPAFDIMSQSVRRNGFESFLCFLFLGMRQTLKDPQLNHYLLIRQSELAGWFSHLYGATPPHIEVGTVLARISGAGVGVISTYLTSALLGTDLAAACVIAGGTVWLLVTVPFMLKCLPFQVVRRLLKHLKAGILLLLVAICLAADIALILHEQYTETSISLAAKIVKSASMATAVCTLVALDTAPRVPRWFVMAYSLAIISIILVNVYLSLFSWTEVELFSIGIYRATALNFYQMAYFQQVVILFGALLILLQDLKKKSAPEHCSSMFITCRVARHGTWQGQAADDGEYDHGSRDGITAAFSDGSGSAYAILCTDDDEEEGSE